MGIKKLTDSHFKEFNSADEKYFKRYETSHLPRKFWPRTFDDYVINDKVVKMVKTYVRNFHKMLEDNIGLLILGSTGSGKTMLASLIGKHVTALYAKNVYFTTLDELIPIINKSWVDEDAKIKFDSIVKGMTLLIVDDIPFTSNTTRNVAPLIEAIISTRSDLGLVTIFTSKQTEAQLVTSLGKETVKKILEVCIKISLETDVNYRDVIYKDKLKSLTDLMKEENN